ncbi:MAG: hypothetical protein [Cressdnaviricota sp.]|nr:MAG: hypothetical protein [Cressdnaviricota sp.]
MNLLFQVKEFNPVIKPYTGRFTRFRVVSLFEQIVVGAMRGVPKCVWILEKVLEFLYQVGHKTDNKLCIIRRFPLIKAPRMNDYPVHTLRGLMDFDKAEAHYRNVQESIYWYPKEKIRGRRFTLGDAMAEAVWRRKLWDEDGDNINRVPPRHEVPKWQLPSKRRRPRKQAAPKRRAEFHREPVEEQLDYIAIESEDEIDYE